MALIDTNIVSAPGSSLTPSTSGLAQLIGNALTQRSQIEREDARLKQVEQAEQVKLQSDRNAANLQAIFVSTGDYKSKRKRVAKLAEDKIKRGEDASLEIETMQATNLDELNVAIGRGARAQANKSKVFELGLEADRAAKPQTTIGKARSDLKAGLITQEDFKTFKATPPAFQTDVGKSIADKQLAIDIYGADSEQVRAFQEAIDSDAKGDPPKLTDVAGVRKEFTKQSGDFIKMKDAFNKLQSASDTGPGDVSLIFAFMRLIDPGSTVREGEFATAEETAGIPARVVNLYNKAIDGDRLGQPQRDSFKAEAKNLFDAQLTSQQQLEDVFKGVATRQGMNPENVVLDFVGAPPEGDNDLTPEEQAELDKLEAKFGNP